MKTYNGHKNWNHWNVALWIGNDEGLYNTARGYIRRCRTLNEATLAFLEALNECGITHTPDGAKYTKTSIRAALSGL